MSLELLKDLKPKKELILEERNLGEIYKELQWITKWELIESKFKHMWETDDGEGNIIKDKDKNKELNPTYIDRTKEHLKNNRFTVLKLVNETLLPLAIDKKLGNGDIVTYQNYSSYLNYNVVYKKSNVLALQQQYGILTFNPNEEMHLKPIPFKTITYHFVYSHEDEQWVEVPEDEFNESKKIVEEAESSDEVMKILERYSYFQKNMEMIMGEFVIGKKIEKVNGEEKVVEIENRFQKSIDYLNTLLYHSRQFHQLQNYLSTIGDEHYQLIEQEILTISNLIDKYKIDLNNVEADENESANRASLLNVLKLNLLKKYRNEPGYHFKNGASYPNLVQFYKLTQKSEQSRTQRSKQQLEEALLSFHNQYPTTLFIELGEKIFVDNFLKPKKK